MTTNKCYALYYIFMKKRLLYWLDRNLWTDTMPEQFEYDIETTNTMKRELKELKKIRLWVYKL